MITEEAIYHAKILIVDDQPANVKLLEYLLSRKGYSSIVCTTDSREVIELQQRHRFDLIVLDINMPHLDGFQVLAGLRDLDAKDYLPVLVITADPDHKLRALEAGAKDFLSKPFDQIEVLTRIRNMLEVRMLYLERKHYDDLTGLPNRDLFQSCLDGMLRQANEAQAQVGLLVLDLDRFKYVADTLGRSGSDRLLQCVAQRLAGCVNPRDVLARLGGDEFAIASLGDQSYLAGLCERIRQVLSEPLALDGHEVITTASIGIALSPSDASDGETLFKFADTALHQAKADGRNTYRFFRSEMNAWAMRRLALENALRKAVEAGEFALHYQPKVDIDSTRIVGLEALLRWIRPNDGFVSPAEFVPILEETGLILEVGAWVARRACQDIAAWRDAGLTPVPIAINVSSYQFAQDDLTTIIRSALDQYDVSPSLLEIEITESSLMRNMDKTIQALHALRGMGLHVSVDDFGTGYSSLAYLRRFPISTLKIDIAFVREVLSNPDDAAITVAIIRMAHSLKLNVIAEGVETAPQLSFLRRKGCRQIQGYYFSKPVPAPMIADMLREDRRLTLPPDTGPALTRRLLLVDGEQTQLDQMREQLSAGGYAIQTASTVIAALELLAIEDEQVVVCGEHLEDLDGGEFLDKVHSLYPSILLLRTLTDPTPEDLKRELTRPGLYRLIIRDPRQPDALGDQVRQAFEHYWRLRGMNPDGYDLVTQHINVEGVSNTEQAPEHTSKPAAETRILVVDDDNLTRAMLRIGLRRAGYQVIEADSGEQALDLIAKDLFDFALLDVGLTGMSGLELARVLHREYALPFVVLTMHEDSETVNQAIDNGALGYLVKPVDFNKLLPAIRVGLARAHDFDNMGRHEKAIAASLEQAQTLVERNDKLASLGKIAAGVAQEINGPIGYVQSTLGGLQSTVSRLTQLVERLCALDTTEDPAPSALIELLRSYAPAGLCADLANGIGDAEEGIRRVRVIVQDLKDYSREERRAAWEWVDIHECLESTINIIASELKCRATLTRRYAHLPRIRGQAAPLGQVFMNMLINAVQAIPASRVDGQISIETGCGEHEIWIDIRDNGDGIDEEHLTQIFEPFFTTKPAGMGTGLGLSLSRGIVERHGGRIELDSSERGTRFRIYLPCTADQWRTADAEDEPVVASG